MGVRSQGFPVAEPGHVLRAEPLDEGAHSLESRPQLDRVGVWVLVNLAVVENVVAACTDARWVNKMLTCITLMLQQDDHRPLAVGHDHEDASQTAPQIEKGLTAEDLFNVCSTHLSPVFRAPCLNHVSRLGDEPAAVSAQCDVIRSGRHQARIGHGHLEAPSSVDRQPQRLVEMSRKITGITSRSGKRCIPSDRQ